ncbi:hypothetical protein SAMN05421769_0106 [Chryseobacterium scophthalmum]|uniref:Uncharacterized protein n=2 Tax=Chryseobacterium scophthalmum TaxID=59733 RepID=A0A1N6EBA3_9FLAO|nr:hypothetical protein SAMN05421769_0106 [Chryseobacterium scophthalmum]
MEKLINFKSAKKINSIEQNLILVERKKGIDFTAFTLSMEKIELSALQEICNRFLTINFIVNIKKQHNIPWNAIEFLHNRNISFGTLGDFMRFCNNEDNEILLDKEFYFVSRALRQHTAVKSFKRLDNRRIEIERFGLPSIIAIMINEYDVTGESIRFARDLYGDFKVVIKTNPNGSITTQAHNINTQLDIECCTWGEFLGKLNSKWR